MMSESPQNESDALADEASERHESESFRPDELPPVEPPSAGFILQLFVVPALIVMAIVAVWALFGKLASSEQDWRTLVAELRHSNEHRRWRGASGLAQLLQTDAQRGEEGQQLAQNPQIAAEISSLCQEQLKRTSPSDAELKQQTFLVRTMAMLDTYETIFPVLQEAAQPPHNLEVRQSAVASIALIAGRADERGQTIDFPDIVESLIEVSADSDPVLRQISAFALGLFPTEESRDRLEVLLSDGDANTRINAAIALARQDLTSGYAIFKDVLQEINAASGESALQRQPAEEAAIVANILKAVDDLSERFTAEERAELKQLLQPVADNYGETRVRLDARLVLEKL